MKWLNNQNSRHCLIGYSDIFNGNIYVKKIDKADNITLRIFVVGMEINAPVSSEINIDELDLEKAHQLLSLKNPKSLGKDLAGNEISLALICLKTKYGGFPCYFALKSECEKWLLSDNYDPTKIGLEEAINLIDSEKNKSGYKVLNDFGDFKVYTRNEKLFLKNENIRYPIPEGYEIESMDENGALVLIEEIENKEKKRNQIKEQYLGFPRMELRKVGETFMGYIDGNSDLHQNLLKIQDVMLEAGVEFSSPGASFKRKLIGVLSNILDPHKNRIPSYAYEEEFFDCILPIIEELIRKSKNNNGIAIQNS